MAKVCASVSLCAHLSLYVYEALQTCVRVCKGLVALEGLLRLTEGLLRLTEGLLRLTEGLLRLTEGVLRLTAF